MFRRVAPMKSLVLPGLLVAVVTGLGGPAHAGDERPFDVIVTGTGRPVILIPGLSTNGAVWEDTVAHLQPRYQAHVLTLAGFGGPDPVGAPFLPRVIDALVDYARSLPAPPVVVGHSLGGFVAFGAASQAPGTFAGVLAVDGVPFLSALSNPAATPEALAPQAAQVRAMYATMSPDVFAMQTRLALSTMITDASNVERAVPWTSGADPATAGIAVAEIMTTDLREAVAAIDVPVRLIAALGATPDSIRPAFRDAYAAQVARIPHVTVDFAERARHFVMVDDTPFFFKSLDALLEEAAWTR